MHWPEFVKIPDKPSAFPELDYPDISAEKDLLAAVSPQRHLRAGGDPYKSLFQLDKWIPAFAGMTLRKGGKRPRTPQRKYQGNQVLG